MDEKTKVARPRLKSGVLTEKEIKSLGLINESFDDGSLKDASYDLRLGNEYYVPKMENQTKESQNSIMKCSDKNGVLKIPRFSTIVFCTEEVLKMPNNVVGRFDLRVRFAMQGLVLQVGTQVEPNYNGKLFGLLLNFSNKEIYIPRGERLLTIEFCYTSSSVTVGSNGAKKYMCLRMFIDSHEGNLAEGTLEAFLKEINNIYEKTENIQKDVKEQQNNLEKKIKEWETAYKGWFNNFITVIGVVAGVVVALFVPLLTLHITKSTLDKGDYPFSELIDTRNNMQNLIDQYSKQSLQIDTIKQLMNNNNIKQSLQIDTTKQVNDDNNTKQGSN